MEGGDGERVRGEEGKRKDERVRGIGTWEPLRPRSELGVMGCTSPPGSSPHLSYLISPSPYLSHIPEDIEFFFWKKKPKNCRVRVVEKDEKGGIF